MEKLLGYRELSQRLYRSVKTLRNWKCNGLLPPPDGILSGSPFWRDETITAWEKKYEYTGKLGKWDQTSAKR